MTSEPTRTKEAIQNGEKTAARDQPIVRQSFVEHLEWASAVVATWPEWKRNVLRLWDDGQ